MRGLSSLNPNLHRTQAIIPEGIKQEILGEEYPRKRSKDLAKVALGPVAETISQEEAAKLD